MASSLAAPKYQEVSLLLLGKTGNGKSSTGNTILGRPAFASSDRSSSQTKNATLHCSDLNDGTRVRVVDTPGIMDTVESNDKTMAKICEAMSLCPNGFNAIIFVLKFGGTYTPEEIESLCILKTFFGDTFLRDFGIIVITNGYIFDTIHKNILFKDWLRMQKTDGNNNFAQILQECNDRCVLFYNRGAKYADNKKKCVDELLNFCKTEIKIPFKNEYFAEAMCRREKVIKELNIPSLHTSIQERLSLLLEQIQIDIKNKTFSYEITLTQLNEFDKEVERVKGDFKGAYDFFSLKVCVQNLRSRLEQIVSIQDKQLQSVELMNILKELEVLKALPEAMSSTLSETFEMMASFIKPLSNSLIDILKENVYESKKIIEEPLD